MAQSINDRQGHEHLRIADGDDAEAIAAIYAPFVTDTIISFETAPPSADEMRRRIESSIERFPWLVCARGDTAAMCHCPSGSADDAALCHRSASGADDTPRAVLGYAYASAYRSREAYQWSAECSVYVDPPHQGHGIGRALYASLFAVLAAQGYRNVYAGLARPNPASGSFHRTCGFEPIGVYRNVGFKNGQWHDVAWMALRLGAANTAPTPIRPFAELGRDESIERLLATGERCLQAIDSTSRDQPT